MPEDDGNRRDLRVPWLRHPASGLPMHDRRLIRRASLLGQIGAAAGALTAFWLDATSAQYHGGTADAAGWGVGIFIFAALPLWLAARNVDSHPRPVSLLFLICGAWLAVPALLGIIDPAIFIAPEYMVEPTQAPEGIRLICLVVLVPGALLLAAAYFARGAAATASRPPAPS
jgi:hypothetical protein